MKRAFALGFGLALGMMVDTAQAADKGGPSAPIPPMPTKLEALKPAIWTGCFADASVSGNFARTDESSGAANAIGLGVGCDYQSGKMVFGGRIGYDAGKMDFRAMTVGGRVGVLLNEHLLAYAKAGLMLDGVRPNITDGVMIGGVGVETWIGSTLTVFLELDRDLLKFGSSREITDLYSARVGTRIKF